MSDTPETDAHKFQGHHSHPSEWYCDADFAANLERQRDTAVTRATHEMLNHETTKADVARLTQENAFNLDQICKHQDELARLTAERDEMLRRIGANETAQLLTQAVEAQCKATDEARAELDRLKARLRTIYDECAPFADGAEDATIHDKLCNRIANLAKL